MANVCFSNNNNRAKMILSSWRHGRPLWKRTVQRLWWSLTSCASTPAFHCPWTSALHFHSTLKWSCSIAHPWPSVPASGSHSFFMPLLYLSLQLSAIRPCHRAPQFLTEMLTTFIRLPWLLSTAGESHSTTNWSRYKFISFSLSCSLDHPEVLYVLRNYEL